MTRSELRKNVYTVIGIYGFAIIGGVLLKLAYPAKDDPSYATFKDLIPLILAIPAAYLAYCFNRRNAHTQALRLLWSNIIKAIQSAREYTSAETKTRVEHAKTLSALSVVIDEVRGVFKNIGEKEPNSGLYPFEALKEIHDAIQKLGYAEKATDQNAKLARETVDKKWKNLRRQFLQEFERNEPDHPESKYIQGA